MPEEKSNPIKQEKTKKRELLLRQSIDPYPHTINGNKKQSCQHLIQIYDSLKEDTTFYIAGRLMRKRPMGKAAFFNLQDETGSLQAYIRKDDFNQKDSLKTNKTLLVQGTHTNPWQIWNLCDIGDILGLSGKLFKTKKGELSLRVIKLSILCKSIAALPEKYHGLEDKELKYRYRHLHLVMDKETRKVFQTRSKIIQEIRLFMYNRGFMEVETPVLQPIYGGAVAEPFTTYFRRLNQKMYLKISPEIYLKKLIVGGFEKVFEIGKNFRNEGIDRTHNPEFTMMEYYQAYSDYQHQMQQFQELVCHVTKKIKKSLQFTYQGKKLDFSPNTSWQKITFKQSIKQFSPIDPDNTSIEVLINHIKSLNLKIDLNTFKNHMQRRNKQEDVKEELLLLIFEHTVENKLWNPTFIIDFPLTLCPLTKKHRLSTQSRIAERFEPYIAGMEIGNAYSELNDPIEQRKRLKDQTRWAKDLNPKNQPYTDEITNPILKAQLNIHQPIDENFIHALEVGMPPTGGVGLGIERLVMILTDQNHIKDSILFPMLKEKS